MDLHIINDIFIVRCLLSGSDNHLVKCLSLCGTSLAP